MTKADFLILKEAVEHLHDCQASYVTSQHVRESVEGRPLFDGMVAIFGVQGHPAANTCYAWSTQDPETGRVTVFAVLHYAPIQSSRDAVRATLATRQRSD
jgi:hypothetical protein